MIEFLNVSKIYNKHFFVLKNLTFSMSKGDFLFVTGESGAGKTTLLKILYGEEKVSSGTFIFNNYDLSKPRNQDIYHLRKNIGVVFQDYLLLSNRTVYENIALALEIFEYDKSLIQKKVLKTLEKVGLYEKADKYPASLSGGERQRAVIARAIANNPLFLIADEPTGNLDYDNGKKIINLFLEINKEGATVIMATHNIELASKTKKRYIKLKNGAKIEEGHF